MTRSYSILFVLTALLHGVLHASPAAAEDVAILAEQLRDEDPRVATHAARRISVLGEEGAAAIPILRERLGDPTTDGNLRTVLAFTRLCVGGDLSLDLEIFAENDVPGRIAISVGIVQYALATGGSFAGAEESAVALCETVAATVRDAEPESDPRANLVSGVVSLLTNGLTSACEAPLEEALTEASDDPKLTERVSGVLGRISTHPMTHQPVTAHPRQTKRLYLRSRPAAIHWDGERFLVAGWTARPALPWIENDKNQRTLFLTDVTDGRVLSRRTGPGGGYAPMAMFGEGPVMLAAGAADGSTPAVTAVDRATGEAASLGYPPDTPRIDVLAGGGRLVAGSGYRKLFVWDLDADAKEARRVAAEDYRGGGHGLCLSRDGELMLVADEMHGIQIREARTGDLIGRVTGHASVVTSIAISKDKRRAVSGDREGGAIVWDLETQKELTSLPASTPGVNAVAISADGSRVAIGVQARLTDEQHVIDPEVAGTVRLFDVESGDEIDRFTTLPMPVLRVAMSDDGQRVAAITMWHAYEWSAGDP